MEVLGGVLDDFVVVLGQGVLRREALGHEGGVRRGEEAVREVHHKKGGYPLGKR